MQQFFEKVLICLLPRSCLLCKQSGLAKEFLCELCLSCLPYYKEHQCKQCAHILLDSAASYCGQCLKTPPYFDKTTAIFNYQQPVTQFITRLKFSQQLAYGEMMGQLLARHLQSRKLPLPECIIPVPLHSNRLRERGYNQALILAKPLAKILKRDLLINVALRKKATQPQSILRAKERVTNIKNAFALKHSLSYQHVAIVDDVMTTGQTVNELAKCLKKSGVQYIEIWCAARATGF